MENYPADDDLLTKLNRLSLVIGSNWIRNHKDYYPSPHWLLPYFEACEEDLNGLSRFIDDNKLTSAYRNHLRDRSSYLQTLYEIRAASCISQYADEFDIHVPTPKKSNRNYDFAATIAGQHIHFEVTLRRDTSHDIHFEIRPGVDKDFAGFPVESPNVTKNTPRSKEFRQLIEHAIGHLPDEGPNIVIIGDESRACCIDVEDAVLGDYYIRVRQNKEDELRTESGLFRYYNSLVAVIWMHIDGFVPSRVRFTVFYNTNTILSINNGVRKALNRLDTEQNATHV